MNNIIPIRPGIQLTPFESGDQANLIQYLNDPVIQDNTSNIPAPYLQKEADEWLQHTRDLFQQHGGHYNLAIRHDQHGVIGGMGAFLRTGLEGHSDEIGYWLASPFRGQGIVPDGVKAFTRWLFEVRPALVRIEARVYAFNKSSNRVLEKAGFEREGLMRKAIKKQEKLIDTWLWAKIREDIKTG
ncbi:MAG: GNAT family N-acetyltransferase [Saprospiraceae bacterium]|nr:GNAT family N-acetyltransferase [Saprospiraceae bacterium]